MENKCLTVQLTSKDLIESCAEAAIRATSYWRACEISEAQINHVLEHPFPGISPDHVEVDQLKRIGEEASILLGVVLIKVDGISREGMVNILAE
jgi:hypothetical protein